jgi:nuclear polyadenylated RNA-binding protein NAB2
MAGISLDTPLAENLSHLVQNKITEIGWGQEDDTSLAEYIVLMLANGKTQDQIASELAGDLLQDGEGIPEFAQWLFEQLAALKNGGQPTSGGFSQLQPESTAQSIPSFPDQESARDPAGDPGSGDVPAAYDADMGDAAPDNAYVTSLSHLEGLANNCARPKGPKGMHGGRPVRGGRMMGQLNKAMDRSSDSVLHRVRGQAGTERINSHGRGVPRGPRSSQTVRPGMQKALNGMGLASAGPLPGMANGVMQNGGQQGQTPMMPISPQQQMEFMAMMEQQARMMAQFMPGMMQQPVANPIFQQNGSQQPNSQGRSMFDRVEPGPGRGRGRGRGSFQNGAPRRGSVKTNDKQDTTMTTDTKSDDGPSSSMEVEQSSQPVNSADPSTTMCHFNLRCTNKDCKYVHQSPAAPPGITVDMADTCTFGAACKNAKCVGRHASPAQIKAHQADEQCKFHPYCTNPNCTFKHPTMPMCRNGADCKVEHCKFTHLQTPCKFNPCMNARCPFKHVEGQRGSYADKVWTADGSEEKKEDNNHVSERYKDFNVAGEEELIKPDPATASAEELIT